MGVDESALIRWENLFLNWSSYAVVGSYCCLELIFVKLTEGWAVFITCVCELWFLCNNVGDQSGLDGSRNDVWIRAEKRLPDWFALEILMILNFYVWKTQISDQRLVWNFISSFDNWFGGRTWEDRSRWWFLRMKNNEISNFDVDMTNPNFWC